MSAHLLKVDPSLPYQYRQLPCQLPAAPLHSALPPLYYLQLHRQPAAHIPLFPPDCVS